MDDHVDPAADSLSLADLTLIDRVCRDFEERCRSGEPVLAETFLVDVPEDLQTPLLRELLWLEVDYRCRRGENPVANEYAKRFPGHQAMVVDVLRRAEVDAAIVDGDSTATRTEHRTSLSTETVEASRPMKFGRYSVLQELGQGGFGTVYLGRDEELQREVAIKIPRHDLFKSPEQARRFLEEARTAANLKHMGIVPIHDVGHDEAGVPFVVMEYLEGESLEAILDSGRLTFRQIAELMADVAEAVHYAHRQGIVHRDLKPSNIMIDARGRACITDFGLAERWEPGPDTSTEELPILAGTWQFIPPEVYAGSGVVRPEIDVYAMGVILYRALTGRYPYDAKNLLELERQIQAGRPPLPQELDPNIPEKLQRVCLKAIESPADRYESAQMLADELRRFLEGREVLARPRRYDVELRGKLQNHYAAIHSWREQNLISLSEMDRLLRPYWFLLYSDSPWPSLARLYPLEAIAIRLGGWLVLLSTLLWPWFYWPQLSPSMRIASVGFPTVALNGVGWLLRCLGSKRNARVFLGIGALLLPLFVAILLGELDLLRYEQGPEREYLPHFDEAGNLREWSYSNAQFTIASAAFLAYCLFLLRHFRGKIFAVWSAIGIYVFYTGCLALCGLKEWLHQDHVAWTVVCYFLPCLLLLAGSLAWDRLSRRGETAMLYAFFPVPLAVLMTLLAYYGSGEWLGVDIKTQLAYDSETANLWWMANGFVYGLAAVLCQRANAGFIRFWDTFFTTLVPISFLVPCNLLFDEGWRLIESLGDAPVTAYELLSGLTAIGFIVLGTIKNHASLSIPGLIGLSVVVFRFTERHFPNEDFWALSIALVGGAAMLGGVVSAVGRARSKERDAIRP